MSGERDLNVLLSSMTGSLQEGVYVFVTLQNSALPHGLQPRMVFQEVEGTTCILLRDEAERAGLVYEFPCRMITLEIHSSLDAVGFMARITTALAATGMGVNPVSGFFHDHLFVPDGREQQALQILQTLSVAARGTVLGDRQSS